MTGEQKFFLCCLSDYLEDRQTTCIPHSIRFEELMRYAKTHQVSGIVYHQLMKLQLDAQFKTAMEQASAATVFSAANNKACFAKVKTALDAKRVYFSPIKGLEVAALYPIPSLRTMGDIDLIVEKKDFNMIEGVFFDLGFEYGKNTPHELSFKKGSLYYEIHEGLIDSDTKVKDNLKMYFNSYREHVVARDGSEEFLDWTFHFLYLIYHIRQHVLYEGIGFRQFMDVAIVIKKKKEEIDWGEVLKVSQQLDLYRFLGVVLALIRKWFSINAPILEDINIDDTIFRSITEKVFQNGVFGFENGDNEIKALERIQRESGVGLQQARIIHVMQIVFPSYKAMLGTEKYEFLKGRKYLTPIAWMIRGFRTIKKRGRKAFKVFSVFTKKQAAIDTRKTDIQEWGIDS